MKSKGILSALGAYVSWGLFPMYWKLLHDVALVQLISHRILWSFFTLMVCILLLGKWTEFFSSVFSWRYLRTYSIAAVLIGVNWLTFIWAVNAGHIVETSLGYFINPLLSVCIGVLFLHERLRQLQWISIGMATAGVLFLTIVHGSIPWIALTLSMTFAFYGFVKKKAPLGSLQGLTLETGILLVPAVLYFMIGAMNHSVTLMGNGLTLSILLAGAGIITIMPLLLFSSAARLIPLSLLGILQYISPTLQFFIGIVVYKEPFSRMQFIGYGFVWIALILFATESFFARQAVTAVMEPE
jgi:chloramphenicol-sensitive protein RarD